MVHLNLIITFVADEKQKIRKNRREKITESGQRAQSRRIVITRSMEWRLRRSKEYTGDELRDVVFFVRLVKVAKGKETAKLRGLNEKHVSSFLLYQRYRPSTFCYDFPRDRTFTRLSISTCDTRLFREKSGKLKKFLRRDLLGSIGVTTCGQFLSVSCVNTKSSWSQIHTIFTAMDI